MWLKVVCILSSLFFSSKICQTHLEVKKEKTEISEQYLKNILRSSHLEVFNKEPSINRINMATSQIFFENGAGKVVYNHNLGNIGGNPLYPKGPYYKISGSRFRAFPSFKDGAKCYWITLKNKCSSALNQFDNGDTYLASLHLQKCGYYRADFDHYYKNLNSIFINIQYSKDME
jgi:hypothetical protein